MITVQSVSTSAEIVVISFRSQHIINFIVKSFKAESFSKFISFGSVVEYDIKNYFDSIFVELTDQFFQFGSLTVMFCLGSIAGVWGKEVNGIVSPVFQKTLAVYGTGIHVLVELEDRHQLHRIDSQFFEVRNLFTKTGKSSRVCDTGRSVLCKSADMKFVDDQVTDLTGGLRHVFPVERIAYHTGVIASNLLLSPFALTQESVLIMSSRIFTDREENSLSRKLRENLLEVFAGKAYNMNRKLRILGSGSLRERIVRFLVECQDSEGQIHMNLSREEMADYLNITRPSLSRELGKMQEEGILELDRRQILVKDQEKMELYL